MEVCVVHPMAFALLVMVVSSRTVLSVAMLVVVSCTGCMHMPRVVLRVGLPVLQWVVLGGIGVSLHHIRSLDPTLSLSVGLGVSLVPLTFSSIAHIDTHAPVGVHIHQRPIRSHIPGLCQCLVLQVNHSVPVITAVRTQMHCFQLPIRI